MLLTALDTKDTNLLSPVCWTLAVHFTDYLTFRLAKLNQLIDESVHTILK